MHVENVGAILLSENTSVSQRTNHIDVHHNLICDYVEDRTAKTLFFHSEENFTYQFTKNISNGTFE